MDALTVHDLAESRLPVGVECDHCIRRAVVSPEVLKAKRGEPLVRIMRKADGAFIELEPGAGSLTYELLWEVAHGEPGTAEYVQEWIERFEADCGVACWTKGIAES